MNNSAKQRIVSTENEQNMVIIIPRIVVIIFFVVFILLLLIAIIVWLFRCVCPNFWRSCADCLGSIDCFHPIITCLDETNCYGDECERGTKRFTSPSDDGNDVVVNQVASGEGVVIGALVVDVSPHAVVSVNAGATPPPPYGERCRKHRSDRTAPSNDDNGGKHRTPPPDDNNGGKRRTSPTDDDNDGKHHRDPTPPPDYDDDVEVI